MSPKEYMPVSKIGLLGEKTQLIKSDPSRSNLPVTSLISAKIAIIPFLTVSIIMLLTKVSLHLSTKMG